MDGKTYVSAFRLEECPDYAPHEVSTLERVSEVVNRGLAEMVIGLYSERGIDHLADQEPHDVVAVANESLAYFRETMRAQQANNREQASQSGRAGMLRRSSLAVSSAAVNDTTDTLPGEKLAYLSARDKDNIQTRLASYSWKVMTETTARIHKLGAKGAVTDEKIARAIKETITNERRIFASAVQVFRGVITVENDYSSIGTLRQKDKAGMRVKVVRPHDRHTPKWMEQTDQWGDSLGLLCSAVTEAETLLILQEWVMANGLPYLPIIAPKEFEAGRLRHDKGAQGNLRADILLCSMVPGRNEIIPVQVKNFLDPAMYKYYDPGVVLVSPKHLGMEQIESRVITTTDSRQRVGTCLMTTYGGIMEQYFAVHPPGKNGRSGNPGKAAMQAYNKSLRPGFEFFDREIRLRIAQLDTARRTEAYA